MTNNTRLTQNQQRLYDHIVAEARRRRLSPAAVIHGLLGHTPASAEAYGRLWGLSPSSLAAVRRVVEQETTVPRPLDAREILRAGDAALDAAVQRLVTETAATLFGHRHDDPAVIVARLRHLFAAHGYGWPDLEERQTDDRWITHSHSTAFPGGLL